MAYGFLLSTTHLIDVRSPAWPAARRWWPLRRLVGSAKLLVTAGRAVVMCRCKPPLGLGLGLAAGQDGGERRGMAKRK